MAKTKEPKKRFMGQMKAKNHSSRASGSSFQCDSGPQTWNHTNTWVDFVSESWVCLTLLPSLAAE